MGQVAGRATRGEVSINFADPLAPDLNAASPALPPAAVTQVRGAAVALQLDATAAAQILLPTVDPRPWFGAVDFTQLAGLPPPAIPST